MAGYLGYPTVFLFAFLGRHTLTIKQIGYKWVHKYRGYITGGVIGGRDGYPEGEIAEGSISHGWASFHI